MIVRQTTLDFKNEFIKQHPEHKSDVEDFYQFMIDEIEDGGSPEHEIESFITACNDLLIP